MTMTGGIAPNSYNARGDGKCKSSSGEILSIHRQRKPLFKVHSKGVVELLYLEVAAAEAGWY